MHVKTHDYKLFDYAIGQLMQIELRITYHNTCRIKEY